MYLVVRYVVLHLRGIGCTKKIAYFGTDFNKGGKGTKLTLLHWQEFSVALAQGQFCFSVAEQDFGQCLGKSDERKASVGL